MVNDSIVVQVTPIKGQLSDLFPRNMTITEELAKTVINKPIKDVKGGLIGRIESVDVSTGTWEGRIVMEDLFSDESSVSMEIQI